MQGSRSRGSGRKKRGGEVREVEWKQKGIGQWSERSRTESSLSLWGRWRMRLAAKCLVFSRKARRPSTKELSSGSQGQGGNTVRLVLLRRTRAPTGKGGSAMVPPRGGTNAGGAPLALPHPSPRVRP